MPVNTQCVDRAGTSIDETFPDGKQDSALLQDLLGKLVTDAEVRSPQLSASVFHQLLLFKKFGSRSMAVGSSPSMVMNTVDIINDIHGEFELVLKFLTMDSVSSSGIPAKVVPHASRL